MSQSLVDAQLAPSLSSDPMNELNAASAKYLISPGGVSLRNNAILTIQCNEDISGKNVGIYRWDNEMQKWQYIGSLVDTKTGIVSVSTDKLGIFRLYIDNKAPKISLISPLNDSTLETSLPEFICKAIDNGSGIDIPSLSLIIDGKIIEADKKLKGEFVVFTIKHELTEGKHTYSIIGSDHSRNPFATIEYTIHVPIWAIIPKTTELLQNYPNPFNPDTWIPYRLSETAEVELRIYNISGQLVKTLNLGFQKPGTYIGASKAIHWDGGNEYGEEVSSGTYFYQLAAGKYTFIKKMVITK